MKHVLFLAIIGVLTISGCGRQGPVGDVGATGKQGTTGAKGDTGAVGQNGSPGIDGTSVSVVKLCPGVTTYPSKFVEVAFCIGDKLYATYSANDGFTSEIPPGSYGSKGINSNCDFVVGTNCSVSN
jgi:predicted small lipoprotein YifL